MTDTATIIAKAMWIDDEYIKDGEVIAADFIDNAAAAGIVVRPFDDSATGLAELDANYLEYDAVILDAWGRMAAGQRGEEPTALDDTKHLLNKLALKKGRELPMCVYTGHMKDLHTLGTMIPKFDKRKVDDLDKLFNWIKEQANNRDENHVIAQHADVFRVFQENLLPYDKKWELVKLLQEINSKDAPVYKANNALARTFVDAVLEGLNTAGNDVMPEDFRTGTKWNVTYATRYLIGQSVELRDRSPVRTVSPKGKIIPDHLGWMLGTIFNAPSSTGSHDYREKHTHYAHRATVNALCEMLIWYHDFIMTKHEK